ncbi:HNH endonuclease, partial [Citrobacter braakii]|uniref:HNH endonuclease n=1 Tax=Citrobacter braakii TaxID=57706 RepID=UPI0006437228
SAPVAGYSACLTSFTSSIRFSLHAYCAIHHKAFDKGSIGLDESMRVQVSPAVNGSGMVGRLFWDFDGKSIALPMMRENYPKEGFVEWHRKEVFRG